jgi:hypothetical protein
MLVTASLPLLYWIGILGLHNLWIGVRIMLPLEGVFAAIFLKKTRSIVESIAPPFTELPIICDLLRILETEPFSKQRLRSLKDRVTGTDALHNIRRLQRLMALTKERDYSWFTALSWCLLWTTQFSMAIDRWRRRHGTQMLEWLAILGEFEALISLAIYSFEHPADVWPELIEHGPVLHAEALAHPLLDESSCVRNDLRLDGDVRFLIVSGSNMSGKSTFLRAVGLNAVLAWMGAPVRCARLQISPLAIGAAIRVEDSLVDGRSHFFAEMQRLRRMIETAGEKRLLFLADEIMIGTNSHDRRIAAEWIVRALILRGAIGLIVPDHVMPSDQFSAEKACQTEQSRTEQSKTTGLGNSRGRRERFDKDIAAIRVFGGDEKDIIGRARPTQRDRLQTCATRLSARHTATRPVRCSGAG